ncbi:MAG: hypothetical protein OXI24_18435 [Candidatus Poribacteria bacterium]|nr:hypothetical protein [Candidatus Poribacteria bacterium]
MKRIFGVFCIIVVSGIIFYLIYNRSSILETDGIVLSSTVLAETEGASTKQTTSNIKDKTPKNKDDICSCCGKSLSVVKQRREELEQWAQDTIAHHGYEEGMKQVTARSPVLAKRIQKILKKEKSSSTSEISQDNQKRISHAQTQEPKTLVGE